MEELTLGAPGGDWHLLWQLHRRPRHNREHAEAFLRQVGWEWGNFSARGQRIARSGISVMS